MSRKYIFTLIVSFLLVSGLIACAAPAPTPAPAPAPAPAQPAKVYKWRIQHIYAPGSPQEENVIVFVKNLERTSGGRIELEVYSGGALVPGNEIFDAVATGTLEMGWDCPAYYKGMMDQAGVTAVPQGARDADDIKAIIDGPYGDRTGGMNQLLAEGYTYQGTYHPGYWENGVHNVALIQEEGVPMLSTRPIRSVADYKDVICRTHSTLAMYVEALGGKTTYMPGEEVYTAFATGTINAATWTGYASYLAWKWVEHAKYVIWPAINPGAAGVNIEINRELWESLPEDIKAIIENTAYTASQDYRWRMLAKNEEARKVLIEDYGVEDCYIPLEEYPLLTQAATNVWEKVQEEGPGATLALKLIVDRLRKSGLTDYEVVTDARIGK